MLPSVLLVDDDPAILRGFSRYLAAAGYDVEQASTLEEARKLVFSRRFDAMVLDLYLPDGRGIDYIETLREDHPHLAIILVTGQGDIPTAVDAMRRGGDNFLTKPVNMQELDIFLKKSLELGALRQREFQRHRMKKQEVRFWGESPAMREIMELARLAAENDSPVCLFGETGTGKSMLGRWIHAHSRVSDTEMVEVNCSSLRGELLASELFGHVKGAFTTAVSNKRGLIEVADGGTLFLDEVGDMGVEVQAQFLKVLEEKLYRPLGDVKVRRSDFRLICATNQDLEQKKNAGMFREDLFFRINVFPIRVPALRERLEDLPGLTRAILRDLGKPDHELAPEALEALMAYSWPGNIRELRNIVERAIILGGGGPIQVAHLTLLREALRQAAPSKYHIAARRKETLSEVADALERAGGDRKKAASMLGISLATLYRRLKEMREQR
jgi:DNA-binding NtrC family response regulator